MTSDHGERGSSPDSESREVQDRLILPLLVPLGAFLFAALIIYGLSRIYLDLNHRALGDVTMATPLALGVSMVILVLAWFFASARSIAAWQVGLAGAVAIALLTGGAIAAAVIDEPAPGEDHVTTTPPPDGTPAPTDGTPAPTDGTPGPTDGDAITIEMDDNVFIFDGEEEPTVPVPAGQAVQIGAVNVGRATHNIHVAGPDGEFGIATCKVGGEEPCTDPDLIPGGETGTLAVRFDAAGEFIFRCDVHPTQMTGTFEAQ